VWEAEGRFLPRWELGLGCDAGGGCEVWGWGRGGGARTSCGLIVGFSGAARHCQGWWGLESWRDAKVGMLGGEGGAGGEWQLGCRRRKTRRVWVRQCQDF